LLVIAPDENAARVKQLFDAKFPPGTQVGALLTAAPVVAAPAVARRSFLGRVVDAITFKSLRSENQTEKVKAVGTQTTAGTVSAGPSLEEMTGRLAETMDVSDDDLRALTQARALAVRDYFVAVGKIDPERIFLSKEQSDPTRSGKGPRVFLTLQ